MMMVWVTPVPFTPQSTLPLAVRTVSSLTLYWWLPVWVKTVVEYAPASSARSRVDAGPIGGSASCNELQCVKGRGAPRRLPVLCLMLANRPGQSAFESRATDGSVLELVFNLLFRQWLAVNFHVRINQEVDRFPPLARRQHQVATHRERNSVCIEMPEIILA
jgi:hypothetical protein